MIECLCLRGLGLWFRIVCCTDFGVGLRFELVVAMDCADLFTCCAVLLLLWGVLFNFVIAICICCVVFLFACLCGVG